MLNGIKNLLELLNENWATIAAIIALAIALAQKIKSFANKTKEERVAAAKAQIRESMLKWITDAEETYAQWVSSGSIKRSQVIQKIFTEYPILAKVSDQDSIVEYIDECITNSLKELRKIVAEQPDSTIPTDT